MTFISKSRLIELAGYALALSSLLLTACGEAKETKLGKRGQKARRAGVQRRRTVQDNRFQEVGCQPQAETGNLSDCGGKRKSLYQYGLPD